MAQFDVFRLDDGELALDVQTDLLGHFDSRIVIPLLPLEEAPAAHPRLNPQVVVEQQVYVVVTQFMTAVNATSLGPPVTNLTRDYDAIRSALDMIFLGF